MKSITADLLAHLKSGGPFIMADLYTVSLSSGNTLRWADFDQDVLHPNGFTYSSSGPVLKRGQTRTVIGVEVDTLDLSIYGSPDNLIDGLPILSAARAGAFDGAKLALDRAFLAHDLSVIGVINLFTGRFSDLSASRTEIQVRVNSAVEALSTQLPRNIYQPGCGNTLYDTACGLSRATWGVPSSSLAGSNASSIVCGLTMAAGWFTRGYIRFTSGSLVGTTRTIKSYTPGQIALFQPLPAVPVAGDAFIAFAGCDHTQATCLNKFNNLSHFRGCPFIPQPETAV